MKDDPTHRSDDETTSWLRELGSAAVRPAAETTSGQPSEHAPESAVGAEAPASVEPVEDLPPLDRTRPLRPPLVSNSVWIGIGAALVAIALIIAAVATFTAVSRVAVPDVSGASIGVARTRLAQVGLKAEVGERRFSTETEGTVLGQTPAPGTQLQKGDVVNLIVSGGSEEFAMPDVIGSGVVLAKGLLESRGLIVAIDEVLSENASDTVLSTTPAPGAVVRTGDTVRLQVATSRSSGVELQPYNLRGIGVLIDPEVPVAGATDVAMDVARRLSALLEASGASVTLLRTGTSGDNSASLRARAAAESTATVGIGLTVKANGQAGRVAAFSPTAVVTSAGSSETLADQIVAELSRTAPPASKLSVGGDNVFDAVRIPWTRVELGVASQRADQTSFADPEWVDGVARSLYTSIGKLYGTAVQQ